MHRSFSALAHRLALVSPLSEVSHLSCNQLSLVQVQEHPEWTADHEQRAGVKQELRRRFLLDLLQSEVLQWRLGRRLVGENVCSEG